MRDKSHSGAIAHDGIITMQSDSVRAEIETFAEVKTFDGDP